MGCSHLDYLDLDDLDETQTLYDVAIRLDPQDASAYFGRGNYYLESENYQKAIFDYTQAISLSPQPENKDAYFHRGICYYKLNYYHKAIADYNLVIYLDTQYADAYFNRGDCYYALNNHQKAFENLQEAATLFKQQNRIDSYNKAINLLEKLNLTPDQFKKVFEM